MNHQESNVKRQTSSRITRHCFRPDFGNHLLHAYRRRRAELVAKVEVKATDGDQFGHGCPAKELDGQRQQVVGLQVMRDQDGGLCL